MRHRTPPLLPGNRWGRRPGLVGSHDAAASAVRLPGETEVTTQTISDGAEGPPVSSLTTIDQIVRRAEANLDPGPWDFGRAGAGEEVTVGVIGILSSPGFAEVQSRSGGRNLFQIYVSGDERWLDSLVERVSAANPAGLCVTVDSAVHARRDRLLEGSFDWRIDTGGDMPPNLEGLGRQRSFQRSFTWAALERFRSRTELPLVVKGIITPGDARRAVDLGVQAVYVSNHGGRGLDHGLSTAEVLQEVVDAVGDRAEVVLDSGVRRGTDICKAVALGARAVLIGRLQCWGLAAGGAEGVAQVLRILRAEIENTMALMGARTLAELTPASVRKTIPV